MRGNTGCSDLHGRGAGLGAGCLAGPLFSLPFILLIVLILLRYRHISRADILGRMEIADEG